MNITEVRYTRRFNTGEFEFEEYTVAAALDEDDKAKDALVEIKAEVLEAHTAEVDADGDDDKGKPAKGKKGKAKKPEAYDRENDTHKELFVDVALKAVAPDWKKTDASKKKAKAASEELEGEDFLDADGEVLQSFKSALKKLMKAK